MRFFAMIGDALGGQIHRRNRQHRWIGSGGDLLAVSETAVADSEAVIDLQSACGMAARASCTIGGDFAKGFSGLSRSTSASREGREN